MTLRLGIWAGVGALIALFWAAYLALTFPQSILSMPVVSMIAQITCPIAAASLHFHFGVKLYWVVLANAATYAIFGTFVEAIHRQVRHA